MNPTFVLLAEYSDDLELELIRSLLHNADIPTELEQEQPRGMMHVQQVPTRLLVPAPELKRAKRLVRRGTQAYPTDFLDDPMGL